MNKVTNKNWKIAQSWIDAQSGSYLFIAIGDENLGRGSKYLKLNLQTQEYDVGEENNDSFSHAPGCQCKQCNLKE